MNAGALAPPRPRLFTVAEYYRMVDAEILKEDDRVELIEGEVVAMSPIGSHHAGCVAKLQALLHRALAGEPLIVWVQSPLRLSEYSEPQPDICALRARDDFYMKSHPTAADALFVIEVADSSLMYDRNVKLSLYAGSGIAEVWLVDLVNDVVELHTAPGAAGYENVQHLAGADMVPRIGIAANEILG
jgi:Uma2 family endonuclease